MKHVIKTFNYIRVSWEGPDGQFSYKRASQFVFICLIVFLVVSNRIQNQYSFYTLLALLTTFLLLAKIITPKEIIELKQQGQFFQENAAVEEKGEISAPVFPADRT